MTPLALPHTPCYYNGITSIKINMMYSNPKKEKLTQKSYRITAEQDKKVKRLAKKLKVGESEFIRRLIQVYP